MNQHAARAGAPTGRDVLAAAQDLLERHGPAGLSVRRVADALGVSRQVVYSRFGDKSGLVRALHDDGFERLSAELAAVGATPGADIHVVALGLAYRRAAMHAPVVFDVMFARPFVEFERDDEARAVALASYEHIVAGARAWLHRNGGAVEQALPLARVLWSSVHGVVMLERTGHLAPARSVAQIEDTVRRLLRGSG